MKKPHSLKILKLALSTILLTSFAANSQISDLPVSASPTTICNGDNSTVTVSNTELNVKYTLRNSANVIIDGPIAGNGSDITFNIGPLTSTETYNVYAEDDYNAILFNGSSNIVDLGSSNRGIDANGISVGMWVKTTAVPATELFFASKYTPSRGFFMSMDMNGKLVFKGKWTSGTFGNSGPSTTSINDGNWHYIVGTSNGATWTTYVDGVLESTATVGTPGNLALSNFASFYLGMYNSSGYYDGEIDDIAIWKKVLTPAEVATFHTSCLDGTETDLVGLYHCDATIAGQLVDDSPSALTANRSATLTPQGVTPCTHATTNTPLEMTQTVTINVVTINDETMSGPSDVCLGSSGTLTTGSSSTGAYYTLIDEDNQIVDGPIAGTGSGISLNTGAINTTKTFRLHSSIDAAAVISGSLDFDGVNDHVNLTSFHRFVNSQVTVACWVKTNPSASSQFIAAKYDLNSGFYMVINSNGKVSFDAKALTGAGNQSGVSTTSVDDGEWHYLVGTYTIGGTSKIYVDGVLESTSPTANGGSTLQNPSDLTIGSYNSNYANAIIDDFAIWRIELSAAEIQANMTNCVNIFTADLGGYFLFNEGTGTLVDDRSGYAVDGSMINMDPATDRLTGVANGCYAYDDCSRVMTQSFTVSVDNNAPVADVASLANVNGQCEVTSLTAPTATDNCSGSITGTHNASLPITSNTTITWTYDDGDGNTSTQTQNVVLNDNTAPVADAATLSDVTAQCEVTSLTAPTATDNCAGAIVGTHSLTLPITSNTTITWTYDDGDGNTSTQTQNIVINDNIDPVADVATLADINSQCAVSSLTAPTATDNCSGNLTGTHNATFPISSNTVVTWTYTDGASNSITQTQNVNVNDNIAPVPSLATLPDVTDQCAVNSLPNPGATDNCSAVLISSDATLPITTSTTVTWTYTDVTGNQSTQTQNVVINDNTDPVADVSTLPDLTDQCQITTLTAPTATDNCTGTITGTHTALLPLTTSTVVTWTYDDGNGNIVTQTQNVVINDNVDPVADAATLQDLTDQCQISTLTAPTATDNCAGTITGTHTALLPLITSTIITWTYDDGNGNVITQTQNVIINDNTAPVADLATLADITEQCEVTSLTPPTATDNCLGTINGTHNTTLPITSNTTITWTYTDGNGNTNTQTQEVIITDAVAPVADIPTLSDVVATCEVTSLTPPTATDACFGSVIGTHSATLPITANTTVTWTYIDGNGNSATQDQDVVINPVDATTSVSGITISALNTGADSYQWIDCDNGNTPITGETNASFTPTTNGNYAVEITEGNCTETSSCENISTIGLHENNQLNITVYPNPTNGIINIKTDMIVEEVIIFDMTGSLVMKSNTTSLSVEHLVKGTYTICIKTNEGLHREKMIKH